ncbi:hypothetical protein QYE76_069913 [Lolium multiflorum]|uniref:Uncharacterized protein n=1 Tax=Lolium multiflorum TaxID=4521 RepID=A0AAD8SIX5_LOLMU|nr:hypothetical protein QYE76_069913 [Lolium multiflorum]
MLPGLMGQGHLAPKAQASQPLGFPWGSTWGRKALFPWPPPPTLDGKGATLAGQPYKGGVAGHTIPHYLLLWPPLPPPYAVGLRRSLRFSSSTTTTTPSCCWTLEEIYHTSAARRNEREELHRHHHGAPSINFNQFLEKEKLKGNGSNFTGVRHVRIFLTGVSMQYVLEAPLGPPPPPAVSEDIKNVYETRVTRYSEIQCAILCSLEAELQKRFEHHDPCEMMRELKLIFETHAAVESYEASKQFFNCMMEEGSSVSEHMFAMSGHAKKLSDLGIVIPNKLGIHRVLQSLPPSYKNFVMNYNMQNMNKELPELFSMLKSAEVEIKKENQVLMVNKTTSFKKQGKPNKGNFKKGGKKVAAPPEKPKAGPKPETVCYYCRGRGTGSGTAPNTWPIEERPCQEERSEGKIFVAKNGSFLEKEFLTKEVTGRKVELDEVDEPSLIDQSSAVPEEIPVQPAPIGEEANDEDHETSNEEAANLADRRGRTTRLMDVKTAFLNGDIEEELYMVQPKGFVDPKNADKERDEPHSYRYSPEPRWRTTPPHGSSSGDEDGGGDGSGVDGEAFRGHFPVGGCRNRLLSPDLGFAMAAALEDDGSRRGKEGSQGGPDHSRRGPWLAAPPAVVWPSLSPPFLRVLLRPENLSPREDLTKSYSRLCGGEEKRALGGQESAGKFPPEGEIDAIAIVIERDIISIIIIIISTIYTAITAPRHRCNNLGWILIV